MSTPILRKQKNTDHFYLRDIKNDGRQEGTHGNKVSAWSSMPFSTPPGGSGVGDTHMSINHIQLFLF